MVNSPIIGMTDYISNFTVEQFRSHVLDPEFLQTIIPGLSVEVDGPYANSVHIKVEEEINRDLLGTLKYPPSIQGELLFENSEPNAWDFYVLHNTIMNKFEGRIRVKQVNQSIKIGMYITAIEPKDLILEDFDMDEIIAFIRIRIRILFQNIGTYAKIHSVLSDQKV